MLVELVVSHLEVARVLVLGLDVILQALLVSDTGSTVPAIQVSLLHFVFNFIIDLMRVEIIIF